MINATFVFSACLYLQTPKPFLDLRKFDVPHPLASEGSWIYPNEHAMSQAKPLLSQTPTGVYIGVGTDRTYQIATLSNATHMLQLDIDVCVVEFNEINNWLIGISKNLADYNYLRWDGTLAEWQQRSQDVFQKSYDFPVVGGAKLSLAEAHAWWADRTRKMVGRFQTLAPEDMTFDMGQQGPIPDGYQDANYLYYEEQFARAKQMVDEGHVQTIVLDLTRINLADSRTLDFGKILAEISAKNLLVSVLDNSNVWWWVNEHSNRELVFALAHANERSYFLLSHVVGNSERYPQYGMGTFYYAIGQTGKMVSEMESGQAPNSVLLNLFE